MLDIILKFDYILYIIWAIVWLIISILNTNIYGHYKTSAVEALGNFAPNLEGNLLVFFTFRWSLYKEDVKKVIELKKSLNRISVMFVILTILCATIFLLKLNR